MSSGIASLHKILKDETRRRIVLLLNEKGSLSYTDLMNSLEIVSTGMLNYHLKVLGPLLTKNAEGQYALTDKGKLASRLLLEFPEDSQLQRKKWQRRVFIALGIGQVAFFSITLTLYFIGLLDLYRVLTSTSWFIIGTFAIYFAYRMQRSVPKSGSSGEKRRMLIGYIGGGAWLGGAVTFFGGGLLLGILPQLFGRPSLLATRDGWWFLVFSFVVAPIAGAIGGYWRGKKQSFQKPKWAVWLDEHLG
jgi:DNA-binding HxlR family transcriptional regulator